MVEELAHPTEPRGQGHIISDESADICELSLSSHKCKLRNILQKTELTLCKGARKEPETTQDQGRRSQQFDGKTQPGILEGSWNGEKALVQT